MTNTQERGRLVRRVPTRLLDVSLCGCLIETEYEVGVGTPGMLHVELWGVECRYPVRVVRVVSTTMAGRVCLAAEFVWGGEATPVSDSPVSQPITAESADGRGRVLAFDRFGVESRRVSGPR